MNQPEDSQPGPAPGCRPPDYVIVLSASEWVKDRFPGAAISLSEALQAGQDPHREPGLEAEP